MDKEINASGFWKISNSGDEIKGDLYVNQSLGYIQLKMYILSPNGPLSYLEVPLEIDFIVGEMISGAKVTLLDCRRAGTHSFIGTREEFIFTAKYMINGHYFEKAEHLLFTQISFYMSNMFGWGAISKYEYDYLCEEEGIDYVLKAKYEPSVLLFNNEVYKITYVLRVGKRSLSADIEEIIIRQLPCILIETQDGKPIDYFIQVLTIIKRLVEFASGARVNPIEISGVVANLSKKIGNQDYPLQLDILHCFSNKDNTSRRIFEYLFNMTELQEKGNLNNWFSKYTLLEPVIELYIENLQSPNHSIRIHFLNIVQALETYHSRFICNGKLSDYRCRVDKITAGLEAAKKEFLLQGSKRDILLSARIADLLTADYKIIFETGVIKYKNFPKTIADTRNYFTHYNPNKKDLALQGEILSDSCFVLTYILEYYLLLELGFDTEYARKKIGEKMSHLENSILIRNMDRDRQCKDSDPLMTTHD